MTAEKQYARYIQTIRRRVEHLAKKEHQNSYDKAEQAALDWMLYYTTYTREDVARAVDSIEHHELIKKLKG